MEGTARIWFTPQQRAELWERWKNGQCVADIARALERRNKSGDLWARRLLPKNFVTSPSERGMSTTRVRVRSSLSSIFKRQKLWCPVAAVQYMLRARRHPAPEPRAKRPASFWPAAY
jgi:hypothetical protein